MLRSIVDLLIAFIDLLKAYADEVQEGVKRTALKVGVLAGLGIVAVGVAVGALFLATAALLWALFLVLLESMSPALAALVTGLIVWVVIGGGAWLAASRALR
jgi:hypothetical protein